MASDSAPPPYSRFWESVSGFLAWFWDVHRVIWPKTNCFWAPRCNCVTNCSVTNSHGWMGICVLAPAFWIPAFGCTLGWMSWGLRPLSCSCPAGHLHHDEMLAWVLLSQRWKIFRKGSGVSITGVRVGPWEDAAPCYPRLSLAPEADGEKWKEHHDEWWLPPRLGLPLLDAFGKDSKSSQTQELSKTLQEKQDPIGAPYNNGVNVQRSRCEESTGDSLIHVSHKRQISI